MIRFFPPVRYKRFHGHGLVLLSLLLPLVSGCAAVVLGIGAGVGTLAYVNGRLIKTYPSEYHATVRAADDTLKHLKIPVTGKVSDELETTIKAARPDGTPVNVDIVRLGDKSTRVGVRTGKVGLWDKRVSAQIQDFIRKRLRTAPAVAKKPAPAQPPPAAARTTPKKQPAAAGTQNHGPAKDAENKLNRPPNAEPPDFTLYFQTNSNELSLWQMEELDRIADYIHEIPDAMVKLNGYTDAVGDPEYNRMISEVRASAMKFYLIGKGILSENIEVKGYGARDFIATNSTAEGRNRNRRVEVYVYSGGED